MLVPLTHCIPWLVVFITECLAIVILNIIAVIVFMKQRKLQRQSTYLIIHLAIVDLLVGAISGPLRIELKMATFCNLWRNNWMVQWSIRVKITLGIFPIVSLLSLAVISLERLRATFCPVRHRQTKKWVYIIIVTIIWLLTTGILATEQIFIPDPLIPEIAYLSYFFMSLFVILVSYLCLYVKVRCGRHPQHHGAAGQRERRLTNTLFVVTLGSLVTWLPLIIHQSLVIASYTGESSQFPLSKIARFHVHISVQIIYFVNSLINPIVYALRLPELRAGISQIFRLNRKRSNFLNLPLRNPLSRKETEETAA